MKNLRIGIVCPYGWDTPGGVGIHIKELAEWLIDHGHSVSVLAPVSDENAITESWLVSAGRPVSIPFNGAVARVIFGPLASSRVKQWIAANEFDVLHLHEPAIPSLSVLAGWAAEGPIVATFHAATNKQKTLNAIGTILDPLIERITAKIAVSETARETLKDRFKTEAVVIPNGIYSAKFAAIGANPAWSKPNTIGFLGRFEESRKGLDVFLGAIPDIVRKFPDANFLIAGPGDIEAVSKKIAPALLRHITFLGKISEEEKVAFFKSLSLYVAPNTGGESFGIILAEAMTCETSLVASDLPAFKALLSNGQAGALFRSGESSDLAEVVIDLLSNDAKRKALARRGKDKALSFDWDTVGEQILSIYEMALVGNDRVKLASEGRLWNRKRSDD
jgi:phosphatidylinositol alpha-mannosyltransferase